MYLTLEEYRNLGGKAEESAFPLLEHRARKKLDYWTQNRITGPDDDIRLCMTLIVNALYELDSGEREVSSFSNDGVSVTFAASGETDKSLQSVYDQIVEILPVELVSVVIE